MMNALLLVAAVAAPALTAATTSGPTCNKWHFGLAIEGHPMKEVSKPDPFWCTKACMEMEGCEAVSFKPSEKICQLFKLEADSVFHEDRTMRSYVFCDTCNQFEANTAFEGQEIMSFTIKDAWWCRKKCMEDDECNAISWKRSGRVCTMMKVAPQFERTRKIGLSSYLFCDYEVMPICGLQDNRMCFDGPPCKPGLSANEDAMCVCGGEYETCCSGGSCNGGLTCDMNGGKFGQCAPCGGAPYNDYQMCCPGEQCNQDDKRRICLSHGGCAPCGGQWQPPCESDPPCDNMLMVDPHEGIQCVMFGAD